MKLPETTVIGLGALGMALVKALSSRDIPVKSIFNRTPEKVRTLSRQLDIPISGAFPEDSSQLGELVFITVPDGAINEVAERLSHLKGDFEGRFYVHCSGNESANLLNPLAEKGGRTASFHPLQTFTPQSGPESFNGIYFSLQGDEEVFPIIENIAKIFDAHSFRITARQKPYLHAAAVMASNYLYTLLDASAGIGALGGLPESQLQQALLPLIQTTLENAEGMSFAEALSGPIKRGDLGTVQKHLELLRDHQKLRRPYCELGLQTIDLAQSSGSLDGTTAEKLRKILNDKNG